jgi:hypothetical protein
MQERTTTESLLRARQQMIELEEDAEDNTLVGMFRKAAIYAVDSHARLISEVNNLVVKDDDRQGDLCESFLIEIKGLYYSL